MTKQAIREEKEIQVYGMTCQHCVNHVTKTLEKLPSVENVQVSLVDSKATFDWDPKQVKMADVRHEIEEAGYSLEKIEEHEDLVEQRQEQQKNPEPEPENPRENAKLEQKQLFKISGMTCANCALTIEKGLKNMPGVKTVAVNFASEKLTVEMDPNMVKEEALLAKIKDLGYAAQSEDSGKQQFKVSGMSAQIVR